MKLLQAIRTDMKNRSKFIKIFCFSICLFFSCGLDVIIYIEPPEVYNFRPEVYDEIFDIDWENRYFEFLTNERGTIVSALS